MRKTAVLKELLLDATWLSSPACLLRTKSGLDWGTSMPNYKIIGADQIEYGPVSAEQIRQWMAEGRVNADTKLQAEGGGEWRRLAEVTEFTTPLPSSVPATCPKCGEKFEERLDSCWKCGTGRDGSPSKWAKGVEPETEEARTESAVPCPNCDSPNVAQGELVPSGRGMSVVFRPEGTHFFNLSLWGGVTLWSSSSYACLECGLVWSRLQPNELKEFISKHCSGQHKDDPYALLSEGGRLEAQGDIDGALAKYQAVIERFPGTGAASDAECSIRNLKDRTGYNTNPSR